MDRIDPLYYTHSSRVDLKEETRIKATSEEAATWEQAQDPNGLWKCFSTHNCIVHPFTHSQLPHLTFISDIFYLTIAMSHYGYLKTIQSYTNLSKHLDDLQRHSEMLNGDGSWMGVSWHSDMER
jgi:ubiquitin conjugation factor E4 B